ncbi:hypothetical protein ES705_23282 [subsurface metagenome]
MIIIPRSDDIIVYEDGKNHSKYFYVIFFGIIIFVVLYFPFFGSSMRYEFGRSFSLIFSSIGKILVYMGTIFLLIGILSFFNMRPGKGFKFLILGVIMLSFAAWLLIPGSVGQPVPKGYH